MALPTADLLVASAMNCKPPVKVPTVVAQAQARPSWLWLWIHVITTTGPRIGVPVLVVGRMILDALCISISIPIRRWALPLRRFQWDRMGRSGLMGANLSSTDRRRARRRWRVLLVRIVREIAVLKCYLQSRKGRSKIDPIDARLVRLRMCNVCFSIQLQYLICRRPWVSHSFMMNLRCFLSLQCARPR